MTRKRDDDKANKMYECYSLGMSLSQVGNLFDMTRQSVYSTFQKRGFELRKRPGDRSSIMFNGEKYTLRNNGYYGKTTGERTLLHRDVWECYNGPIPVGWDIHHKDENKENCDISNLELLPKSEHARLYSPHNNQYTKGRKRKCVS